MAKMQAPKGSTLVSYQGNTYYVEDGFIEVPNEACSILASHGFILIIEPKVPAKRGRPASKKKEAAVEAVETEEAQLEQEAQ